MVKNEARGSKRFWLSVSFGAVFALLVVMAMTGVGAALISKGRVSEDSIMELTLISAYVSAVMGALVARKLNAGKRTFQASMLSAAGCAFLRLLISAANMKDGLFSKSDMAIMACIICGGVTSAILGARRRKKRRS